MGVRVQTRTFSAGDAPKLCLTALVQIHEDGAGAFRQISLKGGRGSGFRNRPTVLLDEITLAGVTVENVTGDSLDVVAEGIDRFHSFWWGSPASARRWLRRFRHHYNHDRPSKALDGRTPGEEVSN